MKHHNLKILDIYAVEVAMGRKTFELRKNDRDYQVGDLVTFDVIPSSKNDSDQSASVLTYALLNEFKDRVFQITYVLKDVPEYGLDKDYCIFGMVPLDKRWGSL